jgi:hypothetical protein
VGAADVALATCHIWAWNGSLSSVAYDRIRTAAFPKPSGLDARTKVLQLFVSVVIRGSSKIASSLDPSGEALITFSISLSRVAVSKSAQSSEEWVSNTAVAREIYALIAISMSYQPQLVRLILPMSSFDSHIEASPALSQGYLQYQYHK